MAGAQSPSALAPFAYDWVGGDIHGLSAFAGKMYGCVPEINGVATALDKQVGRIVGDAGWQGPAATAFANAWGRDSLTGQALGAVISSTGAIVNWLAVELSRIENALEQEADAAAAHGVEIGPDGQHAGRQAVAPGPGSYSWTAASSRSGPGPAGEGRRRRGG